MPSASPASQHLLAPLLAGKEMAKRVMQADDIWQQIQSLLKAAGATLPLTPRCPDVRLIINNCSGREVQFFNPGNHSMSIPEIIPAEGSQRAAMVMVAGHTLLDQVDNAARLYKAYDLGRNGLSVDFVADLQAGLLRQFVAEAYGPTALHEQVARLTAINWPQDNGVSSLAITPRIGEQAAFGTRAALGEQAVLVHFPIFVKGTVTTAEQVESEGMVIAGVPATEQGFTTRPIVPSVARGFYGAHYDQLPVAMLDGDGQLLALDLRTGAPVLRPGAA